MITLRGGKKKEKEVDTKFYAAGLILRQNNNVPIKHDLLNAAVAAEKRRVRKRSGSILRPRGLPISSCGVRIASCPR